MSLELSVGELSAPEQLVTRRALFQVAGVTLVGTAFLGSTGCASAVGGLGAPVFPHADTGPVSPQTVAGVPVGTLGGGSKPIFVAPPGNFDPVVHSVADTLFLGRAADGACDVLRDAHAWARACRSKRRGRKFPAAVRAASHETARRPSGPQQLRRLQQLHARIDQRHHRLQAADGGGANPGAHG